MNQRQEKIITLLDESKRWITGKELSRLMNVSDRTIRSDIEAINRFYTKPLIESNLRSGYRMNQDVLGTLPIKQSTVIPQTPQERCFYLIQELLFEKREINRLDLQDQVFISGYSIDNDVKRIKKLLEPYEDLRLVCSRNYIRMEGSEKSKRRLYKDLLAQEIQGNFLNLNTLSGMFLDFDLLKVKEVLEGVLNRNGYHVRRLDMPLLMINVGIAVERMRQKSYIERCGRSREVRERREYQIAREFFDEAAPLLGIEVVENEIEGMALTLMGKKAAVLLGEGAVTAVGAVKVEALVTEILDTIRREFEIDFTGDMDLRAGLSRHLQVLTESVNENVAVSNIYLQELKRKYSLVFELAVRVGQLLEERLGMVLSESELGVLALHLGAAYERIHAPHRYRAVIIYPADQALSAQCVKKVENLFFERMDVVDCVSYFEEKAILELQPDLILTTLQLKHSLNIPTVQISLFLNMRDESRIFQALNLLERRRFKETFQDGLAGLIDKRAFHYGLDLKTPEEVIRCMCGHLERMGYTDRAFEESVLARERRAATSFGYSFAVPHSLQSPSQRPVISVAFLKKPIPWGDYEVKLVILLALNEEQKDMLAVFFTWLSSMISDANHFASLLETKDYEDFMSKITE